MDITFNFHEEGWCLTWSQRTMRVYAAAKVLRLSMFSCVCPKLLPSLRCTSASPMVTNAPKTSSILGFGCHNSFDHSANFSGCIILALTVYVLFVRYLII
ncbi:uncharacterized protein LOC132636832 isoform X2 [Lycium barbarum]|uniref:uncharacterized protein LOC132636832 isoform X2 n=1 Tax=Lycium barbarum TaxID=112863 RepID=UPI00293EF13D|nr:uncharacterized protein LOC132636832 isoform X2 [Lycium barbarum]